MGIEQYFLAIESEDAPALFLIGHTGVFDRWMHIALIARNDPRSFLRQLPAAILDAGVVVAHDADCGPKFEVLHYSAAPDEKAIIRHAFRVGIGSDDNSILNLPKSEVAVPARKIFAIE